MSEYVFKLPDLGEGTVESEIGEWFIKVGDQVAEEDIVGTMMTDKAAVELSSPISGKVVKLAGEPGDIVAVGAALVVFETDAAVAAEAVPAETAEPVAAEAAPAPAVPPAAASAPKAAFSSTSTTAIRDTCPPTSSSTRSECSTGGRGASAERSSKTSRKSSGGAACSAPGATAPWASISRT